MKKCVVVGNTEANLEKNWFVLYSCDDHFLLLWKVCCVEQFTNDSNSAAVFTPRGGTSRICLLVFADKSKWQN